MTTISRHVTVDANSDRVWAALADFGNIAVFNPSVKRSHLTSTTTEGAGISRECQLAPAGTVQETVTAWTEGESMTVEITEFKNVPAMRSGVADIRIEPKGAQTDVSMASTLR